MRAPCVRCGNPFQVPGEGRVAVTVTFTPTELEVLAITSIDVNVRERLLCAIGLLDAKREAMVRAEITAR